MHSGLPAAHSPGVHMAVSVLFMRSCWGLHHSALGRTAFPSHTVMLKKKQARTSGKIIALESVHVIPTGILEVDMTR